MGKSTDEIIHNGREVLNLVILNRKFNYAQYQRSLKEWLSHLDSWRRKLGRQQASVILDEFYSRSLHRRKWAFDLRKGGLEYISSWQGGGFHVYLEDFKRKI